MSTTHMTRDDVIRIVQEARERGETPDLCGVELRGVDLSRIDLSDVNLFGANLRGAFFLGTNLRGVDLSGTELTGVNLYAANLAGVNLYGANLLWAMGVVTLGCTPSGPAHMVPLPSGIWRLDVGCWEGTTTDLRTLIAGDDWPEAVGIEQDLRRPVLTALADLADAQAAYHSDWLNAVVERWGASDE